MATKSVLLVITYSDELGDARDCAAAHAHAELEYEGVVRCDAWPLDEVRAVYWEEGDATRAHLMDGSDIAGMVAVDGSFRDDSVQLPVTTEEF